MIEANAAALYFSAWRNMRIRFRERDLARIRRDGCALIPALRC